MEILIYVFFLGTWFSINIWKYGFNGGTFLINIYLVSALSGMFIIFNTDFYDLSRLNIYAIIYHCLCLYFFLFPIVYISNKHSLSFTFPNEKVLFFLQKAIIVLGFLTFAAVLPKIVDVLSMDNLKRARYLYNQSTLHDGESTSALLVYFGAFGSAFAYISLYFFFYNLTHFPEKKKLIALLFICSTADAVTSLAAVGRGGIVRWLLMLLFFYFTFQNKINPKLKKRVFKLGGLFSLPLILVLFKITFSRFSDRYYPVYVYILDYLGQSYIYFSYIFEPFYNPTFGGRLNFPFLFPNSRLEGVATDLISSDFSINTFSTFIGSFYKDIGFIYTLALAFLFWLIFVLLYRFNNKPRLFYKFVLFVVTSQIIINGVFYYQYASTTKTKVFILISLASFFVTYLYPKMFQRRTSSLK